MKIQKYKIAVLVDQLIPGGVQTAAEAEVFNLKKLGYDAKLLVLTRKGYKLPRPERPRYFPSSLHERAVLGSMYSRSRIHPRTKSPRYSASEYKKGGNFFLKSVPLVFLDDSYPKIAKFQFKFPFFRFLSSFHFTSPIFAPFVIKRNDYDLIISHGTTTSLTAWSLSRFAHIPYITIIHDPMIYILDKVYSKTALKFFFPTIKPLAGFLEKNFIAASKVCLVDSNVHTAYLEDKYKIKPEVLHLAIDPPKNIPAKRGNNIISFGRWDAGKNLNLLLDLAQNIPSAQLIIAGSWSNKNELEDFKRQISAQKLQRRVELITSYNRKGLEAICKKGRFWIHPHFEAFSLSALEAASLGLPIIIPQKSGITELFQDGKHGFFPEEVSAAKLTKLAKKLLADQKLAWKMGAAAAKLVRKLYNQTNHAQSLAKIIDDVLEPGHKRLIALENGQAGTKGIAGGDQLLAQMLKRSATPLAFTISVIIPQTKIAYWRQSGTQVKLIALPKSVLDKSTNQLLVFVNYLLRSLRCIFKILKNPPDAIYSSTEILPDVLPAFVTKLLKPQTLWIARVHHLWSQAGKRPGNYWVNLASGTLQSILLRLIKSQADLTLALNKTLKIQLQNLGFDSQKITVLGGGVDYHAIKNFKPGNRKRYDAIFLGRLHPVKGIFDLPPIWKTVTDEIQDAKLAIIGPGSKKITRELKSLVKKLGLGQNVRVFGFLPQKTVWSYLKNSEVFIFPDHEAGFGLAVAEAMAAGLPVVGYDIGVLGQIFKSGYLTVPENDLDAFSHTLIKILSNGNLRQKLAYEAERESTKFDWQITSGKFSKILDRMSK